MTPSSAEGHPRQVVVLVVIGVVALVGIVAGLAIGVFGGARPTADTSASPSASASEDPIPSLSDAAEPTANATAVPTSPTAEADSRWQEGGSFGADGAIERAQAVTRVADGFVAVGTHYAVETMPVFGPVPQEGRVWHSTDGRAWEDVTPSGTFADADLTHLYATADGTLIALGTQAEEGEGAAPMAWESADGRAWSPTSLGFPGYWRVDQLVNGARGYLALVSVAPDESTPGDQGIWLSADGQSWELVRVPSTAGERFTDVGAGDDGYVVLGTRGVTDVFTVFAIASADGGEWIEASVPPVDANVLAAQGGDWIAAGTVPSGPIFTPPAEDRVWSSTNGLEWTEIGSIPLYPAAVDPDGTVVCSDLVVALHTAGQWLISNAAAGYGLCGEGRVETPGTQSISGDGRSWEALPWPGSSVNGAVLEGDTLILVGHSGSSATFWFNEAPR